MYLLGKKILRKSLQRLNMSETDCTRLRLHVLYSIYHRTLNGKLCPEILF